MRNLDAQKGRTLESLEIVQKHFSKEGCNNPVRVAALSPLALHRKHGRMPGELQILQVCVLKEVWEVGRLVPIAQRRKSSMKTIVVFIAPLDALKVRRRLLVKLVLIVPKFSWDLYNQLGVWWPKVINSSVTMLEL